MNIDYISKNKKEKIINYKYEVGEIVKSNTGVFTIVERFIKSYRKFYKCKCEKCSYTSEKNECSITKNGCIFCTGRKIKRGVSDMWTKNPELAKLLLRKEEGYIYSQSSNAKTDWKCPTCGYVTRDRCIEKVNSRGLRCSFCSDGISYPEKFVRNVLEELRLEVKTQFKLKEDNSKKYDFYFEFNGKSYIVEVHGEQHYRESFRKLLGRRSFEEEQENDRYKKKLAIENGIDFYIEINATYSELKWMKKNIEMSLIGKIFDLSNIDWNKIEENSVVSKMRQTWELFNQGKEVMEIKEILKIGRTTVFKYLHKGNEIGKCNYKGVPNNLKKIYCVEKDKIYNSIKEASVELKVGDSHISSCCKKKRKSTGGYRFMYYEEYLEKEELKSDKQLNIFDFIENRGVRNGEI